jgi:Apolipoprotein A1/A4/E domain
MAKTNKINDPAEAAYSAIADALNTKAAKAPTVKIRARTSKLPRIDDARNIALADQLNADIEQSLAGSAQSTASAVTMPDLIPHEISAVLNTPQSTAQASETFTSSSTGSSNSGIAPPATAANDDRRSGALALSGMQQRPSRTPLVLASLCSLGWVLIVAYYVSQSLDPAITQSGGYFATANLPTTAAILLAALLPVAFMFTTAVLLRRAQEMRIAARAMTEAALRLTQPEIIASDAMFSLGQAIRREVASMGDGIERAVARAGELETLVHSEVSQLERSYADNELKIRTLLDELAIQREAIGNSASSVRMSIMGAHDNLSTDLQTVAQRITDTVTQAGEQVATALDGKRDLIAHSLKQAGDEMIEQITVRSSEMTDRLTATGETVTQRFSHSVNEANASLNDTGNTLIGAMNEHTQGVTSALELTGNQLIATITDRSLEVNTTLRATGDSLITSITDRSSEANNTLRATGDSLITSFTERSSEVNNTMRATGDSLIMDLGLRGAEVTQRIEETGTRIADTVTSRGDSLALRLVETSDRINDSILVHGKGLEDNLATTGQQAAMLIAEQVVHAKGAFEGAGQTIVTLFGGQTSHAETLLNGHAEDVRVRLDGHADQVRARLAETGRDIVLAIATQGNRVNEALSENARGLSSTLETHSVRVADRLQNFDENVGQRLVSVETLMTTHGEGLMARLVSYSDTITKDMQKQVSDFEQAATTRTTSLSGSFDELITRVDAGLERRGVQLNEQLSKQAIDIAKIMSEGGREVTNAMETKASEIDSIIVQRTNAMADSLGSRAEQITQVLATKASEINETIGGRANEIAETLDNRIGAFEERVVGRLDSVSQSIDQKGFQFAATLVQRTEAINSAFTQSGETLTATLEAKGSELASRIEKSASEFQETIVDGAERSIVELTGAHKKLTGEIASVLGRLNEANTVLNGIVGAAATNLEAVESGLSERVKTLESVMGQIISDTSKTSLRVEKQVALLKEVSGGVLQEAATVSESIHIRGAALAKAAEDLNHAQSRLDLALGDKNDDIRSLVSTIGERSSEVEATMHRLNELLQESLATAEQRARDISTTLLGSSETATAAIKEQHELIRKTTAKENERTSASLRAAYEQVMGEMGDVLSKTTDNFRVTADQLRSVTGEIAQELEATRAEVSRGSLQMPRDISAQTSSIKRAVGEQLKALSELNTIVERSSLDVAPPQTISRRAEPPVERAPARELPRAAPVTSRVPPAPRHAERQAERQAEPVPAARGGGWLSDLLNKASSEPAPAARPVKTATVEQGLESLDMISTDIARLVDAEAVSEVWDRYTRGDRNVFSRRLYTLQGQQTFDEVRRRYRRETQFREAIDHYVEEFERLLKEVAADGRDSSVAQNYLMSDTGKVYTMLAHASGRFE